MDSAHFSAQASTNYKEAFSLFDKRGTGRVPADELGDLLRACGQNPTLSEVAELQKGVGRECTYITLTRWCSPVSSGEFQRMRWFG
jgi:Ca2+-binding EF-hand superfamily protein